MRLKRYGSLLMPELERGFGPDPENYQVHKQNKALEYVKQRRVCLDIGAHVGTWCHRLVKLFDEVHAFEPVSQMFSILQENVPEAKHYPYGLGNEVGKKLIRFDETMTGCSKIADKPAEKNQSMLEISIKRLDDFNIENVDFIKIDVEGYELDVLKGGEETIEKYRPVILIEQKADRDWETD